MHFLFEMQITSIHASSQYSEVLPQNYTPIAAACYDKQVWLYIPLPTSHFLSTNTVQPASTICGSHVDGFVASPSRHCVYVKEIESNYTCNPVIVVFIFLTIHRRTRVYRNAHRNKPTLCSYFTDTSPDKASSFS